MPGDDDIQLAARISCGVCDFCSAVHVNLIDDGGTVFASASVPVAVGEQFLADFRRCMTEAAKRTHGAPAGRQ